MFTRSSLKALGFLLLSFFLILSFCLPGHLHAQTAPEPLKVGFLYTGSANDFGWNNAHELGRKYLDAKLKGSVITSFAENIPENSDCERVMEKMIARGNKLVFATSYGFLEPMLRVADRHPDVRFMHCGRPIPPGHKNVGSYFSSAYYETLYVAGMVAGKMTKTNNIGYIGGYPIPALLWCMNAFTLGAHSVNAKVIVHVVWLNKWEDPAMEAEAARGLIEKGCDVLNSNLNTGLTVCKTAEKAKIYSVSTYFDLDSLAPNGWLTGQVWNWGPFYERMVQSIRSDTWKPEDLRYGSDARYSILASFGKSVPKSLQNDATKLMTSIEKKQFKIFTAPLKDREGNLRLAPGKIADQAWLDNMNWFVPGIEGTLPRK